MIISAPSLQAIAAALTEEQHPIAGEILDAVRTFVSDGRSPFFGRDVILARHEAGHLCELLRAGHRQPTAHATAAGTRDERVVAAVLAGAQRPLKSVRSGPISTSENEEMK